ncbi:MAG: L-threonylcarbamoyladenylate synthase [Promethearchaeota archaeon]
MRTMGFLIRVADKNIEDIKTFLNIAVDYIIEGKVIAFPTDSVYCLGGDPLNLHVIEQLNQIKFQEENKGFLLLLADMEEALKIAEFNPMALKLAKRFWPGQLSLVLKRKSPNIIPPEVSARAETIGIQIPQNQIILTILKLLKERGYFAGIMTTSANYSDEPPSISGKEVVRKFLNQIDLILDGGISEFKIPTTIVDCTGDAPIFLHIGALGEEQILEAIKE